jgi:hypothetical protein
VRHGIKLVRRVVSAHHNIQVAIGVKVRKRNHSEDGLRSCKRAVAEMGKVAVIVEEELFVPFVNVFNVVVIL